MKRTNEYLRRHSIWLVLAALVIVPARLADAGAARCDIIDVIEMVEDRLDRTKIRGICSGGVDAGSCTLTKVVRLAKKGLDEFEIEDTCSDNDFQTLERQQRVAPPRTTTRPAWATICDTPYSSCPIVVGAGQPGEVCWCTTAFGTAYGIAR